MRIKVRDLRKHTTRDMKIVYRIRSTVNALGAEVAFLFLFIWQLAGQGFLTSQELSAQLLPFANENSSVSSIICNSNRFL